MTEQLTKLKPIGRCQCPADYYHGDGHYIACPASTHPGRWPLEFRDKWCMAQGWLREFILEQRRLGLEVEPLFNLPFALASCLCENCQRAGNGHAIWAYELDGPTAFDYGFAQTEPSVELTLGSIGACVSLVERIRKRQPERWI